MTDTAGASSMRPVPQMAIDFVKGAEACWLTPYLDGAGHPTNGWGNTVGVVMGQPITMARALADLGRNLDTAARRLADVVHPAIILKLSEHQYSALLSFVFNLGAGASWTIWKILNAGEIDGDAVPDQMKRFDKEEDPKTGQEVAVPGLDHRRLAEVNLWRTADVAASVAIVAAAPVPPPPSSYTRTIQTPPTPQTVKPLMKQPSFIAQGGTAIVAAAAAAQPVLQTATSGLKSVSDTIAPYTDAVPAIAKVQTLLMMALAGLAVVALVLTYLKHRADQRA